MTLALFVFTLITAFLSGALALFAPCCITFLLPSYLASVFKVRYKIILMTIVFALGLATILVPISLGVAWLSSLFAQYHSIFFLIGGLLLILYGILSLFGKSLMIPPNVQPRIDKTGNFISVYTLGIFSGIASSCCAPVLAGILTLTALSSSIPLALIISLSYILGMTLPLFVLAMFWDNKKIGQTKFLQGFTIKFHLRKWNYQILSTHLFMGLIFLATGVVVLYVAVHGEAASASTWQTNLSAIMQAKIQRLGMFAQKYPYISMMIFIGFISFWIILIKKINKGTTYESS